MSEDQFNKEGSREDLSNEELKKVAGGHHLGKVQNQNVGGRIAALRAGARGVSAQGLS